MKVPLSLSWAAMAMAMPAFAQNQPEQPAAEAQPAQQQPATEACVGASAEAGQQPKRKSLPHDAGNAAVTAASQVAGAGVAGPVGAAVGGVVVNHAGHAIKKVVKGDRRRRGQQQAQAQGAPADGAQGCAAQPAG